MHKGLITILTGAILLGLLVVSAPEARSETKGKPWKDRIEDKRPRANALRELLVKGLKATRKEEQFFIDAVVKQVELKQLKLATVYASFDWARRRRPQYPFPYFAYAVTFLAKKEAGKPVKA